MPSPLRMKSSRRFAAAALLMASALALGACEKKSASLEGTDGLTTASTDPALAKNVQKAAKAWEKDPGNADKAIAYSEQLGSLGLVDRKMDVLKHAAAKNPGDQRLQSHYGKTLAEMGRLPEAAKALESAAGAGNQDWKTFSALGSTYDQQGRHEEARVQYERALALAPGEPSVLNNIGMSYALGGNLKKAEETLRNAFSTPAGQKLPRVRQNLALVVGLQGRFDEARDIASKDLPPAEVEENMKFLQAMLNQPNTWQQLKKGG